MTEQNSLQQTNQNIFINNKASMICIPFNKGQRKPGVKNGPQVLVEGGIKEAIESAGIKVENTVCMEFQEDSSKTSLEVCSIACQKIADVVEKESKCGKMCINIGGDHSIGTGTIAGLLRTYPDLCVIWIDAHPDLNRVDQSISGNVHGMPLSFLMKDTHEKAKKNFPKEYEWCQSTRLKPSRLAYLGLRDVDDGEAETINRLSITAYDILSIERLGIVECVTNAINFISNGYKRPIHVSFDVDSMDPTLIPCTGTPVDGGLTFRETLCIAEMISKTGRLVGLDIVEVNPELGKNDFDKEKTVANTIKIVKAFCGSLRHTFTNN